MKPSNYDNLKAIFLKTIGVSGGFYLVKKMFPNTLRIFMYHRFSKKTEREKVNYKIFEKHIKFLKKYYEVINFEQLSLRGYPNKQVEKKPYAIITVDDGYNDFYLYAYPILKKYHMPAVLFPVIDFIENRDWLLHDIIKYMVSYAKTATVELQINDKSYDFSIMKPYERNVPIIETLYQLISYKLPLEQKELIHDICDQIDIKVPKNVTDEYSPLTWDQIKEMSLNHIEIGAHTLSHPILTALGEKEARDEIVDSINYLNEIVRKRIYSFCYPNGTHKDYNEEIISIIKDAGVQWAVTALYGINSMCNSPYELKRIGLGNNMSLFLQDIMGIAVLKDKVKERILDS